MSDSLPIFEYTKSQFDDKYSSGHYMMIILVPFFLPFLLFQNGFLDLTYLPLFLMLYISIILLSLPLPFLKIKIFKNYVTATNIFGIKKNIQNTEISYDESYFMREDGKQTLELVIKYKKRMFKIYKDEINDYETLRAFCKKNYKKFSDNTFNYYHFSTVLVIITGVLLQFSSELTLGNQEFDNKQSIKENGYVNIKGTLRDYKLAGKNGKFLLIELNEYPKFDFSVINFYQKKDYYFEKLNSEDTLILYIAPNQYQKKIKKNKSLKFYDKYYKYNRISVYKID